MYAPKSPKLYASDLGRALRALRAQNVFQKIRPQTSPKMSVITDLASKMPKNVCECGSGIARELWSVWLRKISENLPKNCSIHE